MIRFVYTGVLRLNNCLIRDAIVAADFLLMEVILAELITYAIKNIQSIDCFQLLEIEDKLNNDHLRSLIGNRIGISNNYEDKRFLTLNCNQLLLLIKYRPEKSDSEKFLEMMARWAQAEDGGLQCVHLLLSSFTITEKIPVSVLGFPYNSILTVIHFTDGSDYEDPFSCLQDHRKSLVSGGFVGASRRL